MKKKIFGGIAVMALATVIGVNIKMNQQENKLADLSLQNVEALAEETSDSGGYSCSASANCFVGDTQYGSISCTGTKTCESGAAYVKCDGNKSECV